MNPILAMIIANIIWGAASPIFKYALGDIPPFTLAFIRFFGAGLICLPFIYKYPFKNVTHQDWSDIILAAIFGITINISFLFLGLQIAPSINASIIGSSSPLFMFALSVWFLHEKPKLKVFSGMTLSLVGVLVIIFSPILFDGGHLAKGEMLGNVLYVISRLGAVLGALALKNVLKKVDAFVITAIDFLIGGLTFLPFVPKELVTWSFSQITLPGIVGIVFGLFFSSLIAYYLFNYGLSKIAAEEAGIFMYIDPVIAVLVAIPLLGEIPNVWFAAGAVLVFAGIYISEGRIQWHPLHKLKR